MKKIVLNFPNDRVFKRGQIYDFKVSSAPASGLVAGEYLGNDIYIVETSLNSVSLIFLGDNISDQYEIDSKTIVEFKKSINIFSEKLDDEVYFYKLNKPESHLGIKAAGLLFLVALSVMVFLKIKNKWVLRKKKNKFKTELKKFNFDYVIKAEFEEQEFKEVQSHVKKMIYQKNWAPEKDAEFKKLEQRISDV